MAAEQTATRQLFVKFLAAKPKDSREIERLFAKYGSIKLVFLAPNHSIAYVTFYHTKDACAAKDDITAQQKAPAPPQIEMEVAFIRATRLLQLDKFPQEYNRDRLVDVLKKLFADFGFRWIDVVIQKTCVYIFMNSIRAAVDAVESLRGCKYGSWELEIEFHKETSHKPSHQAYYAPEPRARDSAVAPAPPVASTPSATANSQPVEYVAQQAALENVSAPLMVSASLSPEPSLGATGVASSQSEFRSRSRSRSRSPSAHRQVSPDQDAPLPSPSSSPSSIHSRSRSSSRSPPRRTSRHTITSRRSTLSDRSRRSSHSSHAHRSVSPKKRRSSSHHSHSSDSDDDSSGLSEEARERSARSFQDETLPRGCKHCATFQAHVKKDHTITGEEKTKGLVTAWFNGNFEIVDDSEEMHFTMARRLFLKHHLNKFLGSVGLPKWTARTPLYAWFIQTLMRCSEDDANNCRPWRLRELGTVSEYKRLLRRLLDKL